MWEKQTSRCHFSATGTPKEMRDTAYFMPTLSLTQVTPLNGNVCIFMLICNIGCAVDISYTYQVEKVRMLVIINWILL